MTVQHPAKFSAPILTAIRAVLADLSPSGPLAPVRVLDPFAGVGGIHELRPEYDTHGVELEAEWADTSPYTRQGDATDLRWIDDATFDVVCTSPAYGNRMADSYDGSGDLCKPCAGSGDCGTDDNGFEPCPFCDGTGKKASTRYTYRIALGRPLTDGNGAGLQWGDAYRTIHRAAWAEAARVLRSGGLLLLNISDHYRQGQLQGVDLWHTNALGQLGFDLIRQIPIKTSRQGNGANRELRDSCEWLLVFRNGSRRK